MPHNRLIPGGPGDTMPTMTPIARLTTLALAAATLAALAGCSEPYRRPMDGRPSANPVAVNAQFDPLFRSVDQTLRDHRFGTEANPRLGEVRTRALTGQQVWEFWRSDSVGLYNHMESSLHTILRTADVRVYPIRDKAGQPLPDQYFLEVRVYTDRWSVPERDLTADNQISSAYSDRGLVNELELRGEGTDGAA